MIVNKIFIILAIAVYSGSICLFFKLKNNRNDDMVKSMSETQSCEWCIRVCCANKALCNEQFVTDNFPTTLIVRAPNDTRTNWDTSRPLKLNKIIFEAPNCILKKTSGADKWKLYSVREISQLKTNINFNKFNFSGWFSSSQLHFLLNQ